MIGACWKLRRFTQKIEGLPSSGSALGGIYLGERVADMHLAETKRFIIVHSASNCHLALFHRRGRPRAHRLLGQLPRRDLHPGRRLLLNVFARHRLSAKMGSQSATSLSLPWRLTAAAQPGQNSLRFSVRVHVSTSLRSFSRSRGALQARDLSNLCVLPLPSGRLCAFAPSALAGGSIVEALHDAHVCGRFFQQNMRK